MEWIYEWWGPTKRRADWRCSRAWRPCYMVARPLGSGRGRGSLHNLQVKVCSSEANRASSGNLVNYSSNTKRAQPWPHVAKQIPLRCFLTHTSPPSPNFVMVNRIRILCSWVRESWINVNSFPTRCDYRQFYYISADSSTCFGRYPRPWGYHTKHVELSAEI